MIRIYARCIACKHVVMPPEVNEYSRPTCLVYPNGISIDEALKERTGEPGECNGVCQFEKKDLSYILEEVMKEYGHID